MSKVQGCESRHVACAAATVYFEVQRSKRGPALRSARIALLACLLINAAANAADPEMDPAVHGKWYGVKIRSKQLDREKRPWIEFGDGRGAGGHDGCNSFSLGAYVLQAGKVTRDDHKQTLQYCGGGEELFTANIMAARSYETSGDDLLLLDEKGQVIVRLERAR